MKKFSNYLFACLFTILLFASPAIGQWAGPSWTGEVNGVMLKKGTTGFTAEGGETKKKLTVTDDTTLSGSPYTPGGTDVAVTDGGTGVSTLADGGIVVGNGTNGVEVVSPGATTEILVGGGAGTNPVWTTATGTGAPVRADGPTLTTPALGTPASGTLTNCTGYPSASTTVTGVSELATTDETITGTDTARTTTPAGVAGAMAVQTNPLAKSQGVHMTYAASGATSITVADNDNIDFGTGDFTLVWRGALPDWTPSATVRLLDKHDATNGYRPQITAEGKLRLLVNDGSDIDITSTSALGFVDGTEHELAIVVTRNSSVAMYADGKLIHTASITESPIVTVSNAVPLYVLGTSATRFVSDNKSVYTYNRALTAAEVLDLYRNGIAFADKWGSQTELATNGDFAVDTGWNLEAGVAHDAVNQEVDFTAAAIGFGFNRQDLVHIPLVGEKYLVTFTVKNYASGSVAGRIGNAYTTSRSADGTYSEVVTVSGTEANRVGAHAKSANTTLSVDDLHVTRLGATLALESEGIQPEPGQWLDSSSNKNHAMQPASGSSLTRRMKTFEVRWTNTWAGTHEAQYIGGVNQAVLPANCYIESIIGVVSGATIEDIIIGDGSDTDRWVTITTGLSAGTTSFTLANRISDGTNYKLVVDPDANFTGSITWTIKGIILQ